MRLFSIVVSIVLGIACLMPQTSASPLSLSTIQTSYDLMSELAQNYVKHVGDIMDNSISSVGSTISAMNPYIEQAAECLDSICLDKNDPDVKRNVSEIIRSRGFGAQEFDVATRDGYILTIQRIINPLISEEHRNKLKPIILQHGLMSSSVDWVINSVNVRPQKYPAEEQPDSNEADTVTSNVGGTSSDNTIDGHQASLHDDSQKHPNSLGFYLANQGYDVFLANSRGNIYGQRHKSMTSWSLKFWDFTFDEQIKYDLPDTIEFIQNMTGHKKVGYVGHSQGTTMIFGLLADQPDYADIVEPVIALAPTAYVNNCISPAKYFAIYTPIFQHTNMWFATSNVAVRYLAPLVCKPNVMRKEICANLLFLSVGFDESQFNDTRVSAYMSHMPSGTSVKNIAHWGQQVISGKFAHFDHGILVNQAKYGHSSPPEYDLSKIRSKSISFFTAENDWLASPKDVARLKADLKVPLFRWFNLTESVPNWNHIDFVYGKDCGQLVNTHIVDIFKHFDGEQYE